MDIRGPIPFHVARAYGVQPALNATKIGAVRPMGGVAAPVGPSGVRQVDATGDLSRVEGVTRSRGLDHLVGGTVNRPIAFDGAATTQPSAGSLPMYTRAADKIEAAVAVNLGRMLDVQG
ncbi:MAG: hypothetical protein HRU76_08110 [Phycisphaeraceae bacterium]|nr:hypothetical protein [Phycisphaerales bacterium]QOJ17546.1 MAG: hypothetical protein HRU76_08110 [Phycisphaeraceae bacterium]